MREGITAEAIRVMEWKVEQLNQSKGKCLYYDCPKCHNKGYIVFLNYTIGEIQCLTCDCMEERKREYIKRQTGSEDGYKPPKKRRSYEPEYGREDDNGEEEVA